MLRMGPLLFALLFALVLLLPEDCCCWEATTCICYCICCCCADCCCWPRLPREEVDLWAAAMEVCRAVSSRIIISFWSCLSAWTVCACWRRLSRRENCLPQWQLKGRSPVCFLRTMFDDQRSGNEE